MSAISVLSSSAGWVWRVEIGGEGSVRDVGGSRDALEGTQEMEKGKNQARAICNMRVAPPADSLHTPAFVQTSREEG